MKVFIVRTYGLDSYSGVGSVGKDCSRKRNGLSCSNCCSKNGGTYSWRPYVCTCIYKWGDDDDDDEEEDKTLNAEIRSQSQG